MPHGGPSTSPAGLARRWPLVGPVSWRHTLRWLRPPRGGRCRAQSRRHAPGWRPLLPQDRAGSFWAGAGRGLASLPHPSTCSYDTCVGSAHQQGLPEPAPTPLASVSLTTLPVLGLGFPNCPLRPGPRFLSLQGPHHCAGHRLLRRWKGMGDRCVGRGSRLPGPPEMALTRGLHRPEAHGFKSQLRHVGNQPSSLPELGVLAPVGRPAAQRLPPRALPPPGHPAGSWHLLRP